MGRPGDGPFFPEIPHQRVTANYGRGELVMKNWKTSIGGRRTAKTLVGTLAMLILALRTVSAATSATQQRHADPLEKGAAGLMRAPEREHLPSETNNRVLIPLVEKWRNLPMELRLCPTIRSNRPVNIAIHIISAAPGKPVLAFVHGILADYLMWEYVAADLAGNYEIWLVDLPGCGESDAPEPSTLEPDGYSPTAMGDRLWQALRQCLAAKGDAPLQKMTLVGHSIGGTVVIGMLSAPELQTRYAQEQQRVDRAVLFAPCNQAVNAVPLSLLSLLNLKSGMVTIGRILGVFDSKVRDLTKRNFQVPEFATIERQQRFAHALEDYWHREATKAMLRQLVPFDPKTLRPIWPGIEPLVAEYRNIRVPVLIVHGTWDETICCAMSHELRDYIPGAALIEVPGCGHSLPTEDPLRCARLIAGFQQDRSPSELAAELGLPFYPASQPVETSPLVPVSTPDSPESTN
jgi:pimeloyl-ACP methyl ester carboxylesterase